MNKKIKRYLRRTYKNKIMAVVLVALGILSLCWTMDATFLVFAGLIALPLFLAEKNYICV